MVLSCRKAIQDHDVDVRRQGDELAVSGHEGRYPVARSRRRTRDYGSVPGMAAIWIGAQGYTATRVPGPWVSWRQLSTSSHPW